MYDVVIPRNWLKNKETRKAPPPEDGLEKVEKWLWIVILAGIFFVVVAQVAMKQSSYSEKQLKRDLEYKEFLAGGQYPGEWRLAYLKEAK